MTDTFQVFFLVICKIEGKKLSVAQRRYLYTCELSETFLFTKLYMSDVFAISCLQKHG